MSRVDHTKRMVKLLSLMYLEGENPFIEYGYRSTEEQQRLYRIGRTFDAHGNVTSEDKTKIVTNCDGIHTISGHQRGKADDLGFLSDDATQLTPPKKGWSFWHQKWSELGGQREIIWDEDHFESP